MVPHRLERGLFRPERGQSINERASEGMRRSLQCLESTFCARGVNSGHMRCSSQGPRAHFRPEGPSQAREDYPMSLVDGLSEEGEGLGERGSSLNSYRHSTKILCARLLSAAK